MPKERNMLNYKEIGRRIRYYRGMRKVTQEQLAFEIQSSAAYLSNIERGIKKPSLEKLLQLSNALDVPIEAFLSPSPTWAERATGTPGNNVCICSGSDKNHIVNSLSEIIRILEQSS